jgi:sulfatase maturation enzyme AslB (radical SAM superfamily)
MKTKYKLCSKMWTDLNIDLGRKNIRHCCKTLRNYEIPLLEVKNKKKDIFNFDKVSIQSREDMLVNDVLPDVCFECKRNEPNSIRHAWNIWSDEQIDYMRPGLKEDVNITNYIEIDIGSKCDMACVYCGPWSSSAWAKELRHEPTNLSMDDEWQQQILKSLIEYVDSFPKDKEVLTFNILGGEPLIMPVTYDFIDMLAPIAAKFDNRPEMMITTNLNTPKKLLDRFIDIMKKYNKIFKFTISVSIEDTADNAEKVRHGLNWERFEKNLNQIKQHADFIGFTNTLNILSVENFDTTIDWMFNTMQDKEYSQDWSMSVNMVHSGKTDVAYADKNPSLKKKIIKSLDKYLSSMGGKTSENHDVSRIYIHIDNLFNRMGQKEPGEKFFNFWNSMGERKKIDYYQFKTLKKLRTKYDK